jgi:hypothetical protein
VTAVCLTGVGSMAAIPSFLELFKAQEKDRSATILL